MLRKRDGLQSADDESASNALVSDVTKHSEQASGISELIYHLDLRPRSQNDLLCSVSSKNQTLTCLSGLNLRRR